MSVYSLQPVLLAVCKLLFICRKLKIQVRTLISFVLVPSTISLSVLTVLMPLGRCFSNLQLPFTGSVHATVYCSAKYGVAIHFLSCAYWLLNENGWSFLSSRKCRCTERFQVSGDILASNDTRDPVFLLRTCEFVCMDGCMIVCVSLLKYGSSHVCMRFLCI